MTNKERYQRAFSPLHASGWTMEEPMMKKTKHIRTSKIIAICAAVVLVLVLMSAVYAVDVGGIQRSVQIWMHGDQTDATLDIQHGESTTYTLTYEDEAGAQHTQQGGGVAFDIFGNERPATEEEILEQLMMPEVEYKDDGTVWVYYKNQSVEITDQFDDDGVCYVQLKDGDETLYLTIKYENGYCISKNKYASPWEFN